jgi:hypothetical protein
LPPDPPPHPPRRVPANPRHRIVAIAIAGPALRFVAQQAAISTAIPIAYNGVGPGSSGDLDKYQKLVIDEPESAVSHTLKEAFLTRRKDLEGAK